MVRGFQTSPSDQHLLEPPKWIAWKMSQNSIALGGKSSFGWGNRGWLEIAELILRICEQGTLKTHIMYQCNLNSKQIEQHLDFLLVRSLVVKIQQPEDPKRSTYLTTDRGRRFMAAYQELAGIFRTSNEELCHPSHGQPD